MDVFMGTDDVFDAKTRTHMDGQDEQDQYRPGFTGLAGLSRIRNQKRDHNRKQTTKEAKNGKTVHTT